MERGKQRNAYIDMAKGCGIILVVLGHCIQFGNGPQYMAETRFFEDPVFSFIYTFHMPLFMLISGYFFYGSNARYSFGECIKRKALQLLVPIVSFAIGLVVIKTLCSPELGIRDIGPLLLHEVFSSQWFLWSIWWFSLLAIIGRHVFKDTLVFYLILIVMSIFLFSPGNWYNTESYLSNLPLFMTGYLTAKYQWDRNAVLIKHRRVICSSVSILFLAWFFIRQNVGIHDRWHWMNHIEYLIVGIAGSVAFLWVLFEIKEHISVPIVERVLTALGRETMGIYLISGYMVVYLLPALWDTVFEMRGRVIWETLAVLAISYGIVVLFRQIPICSRLFLGGNTKK